MTPNLRFNKKLTKQLIKASSNIEGSNTLLSINWNIDNKDKVYGLENIGLFHSIMFYLQKIDEERFRLVVADGNPLCKFFMIDDIEKFIETVGVKLLELDKPEEIHEALKGAMRCPNNGIITVENDEVFVYEHTNY